MSYRPEELKVKKDSAISALFSLYKAAGDASSAVLELINHLESIGFDAGDLRTAFTGGSRVDTAPLATAGSIAAAAPPAPSDAKPSIPEDSAEAGGAVSSPQKDEVDGRKKPKRAPKDPNAPKRPLNAFLKFRNQESKKISEERKSKGEPDLSRSDMSVAIKEHWENLPESVRENLIQESKSELERYHSNLASYKESTTTPPSPPADASSQADGTASQSELSQPASQALTQDEETTRDVPVASPLKKKSKKRDGKKEKEDGEKKKRKKSSSE